MEEKFLYHIWDAGHLLTPLKTASGKHVQVGYQGQFNTARGPDFRNAIINLDGEILRGDVEIHVNSYDWTAHEHHEDVYFNNVILHVVLNAGQQQFTIKENGEAVEIMELQGQLSDEIRKLLETQEAPSTNGRGTYCELLSAVDNDALVSILQAWGMKRFRKKAQRFNAMLMLSDFDQVLYEGIMEAMGYDKNKHNMLNLAQAIPLSDIRAWQKEGLGALELVAILSCGSGLLDRRGKHLSDDLRELLADAYERQLYHARSLQIDWQLFRIRPLSHPLYRIFAVASLVHKTAKQGLMEFFLERVLAGKTDGKQVFQAFAGIFSDSALPGAEKMPRPGKALISNIYVNIFLPICFMYCEKHADAETGERVIRYYSEFSGLQDNHVTRFMSRYLSPAHMRAVNGKTVLQQGLMEIFHRYCNYHLCAECQAAKP